MSEPEYTMRINLNVLNHLGFKLYSNVPAVLSEAVANSWDADATHVDIKIESEKIIITDDGHGMTLQDINDKYLTVGYERRNDSEGRKTELDRSIMGRKGIGKLSLFSIADTVEVQTVRDGDKNGFVMSARKIEEQIREQDGSAYHPDTLPNSKITLEENGTRIVLTGLKKQVHQTPTALRKRLARRFSIIGTEYDFTVKINGDPVGVADRSYFYKLQYLWHYGKDSEKYVELCNSEKLEHKEKREEKVEVESGTSYPVKGWIGTVVGSGDLKDGDDNLNKIVIMVRGKLAQEDILEDFTEGGLYTKYIIGEIHANFLDYDDLDDIATTNRQEIIKDDQRYIALRSWVKEELRHIKNQWTDLRKEKGEEEARQIPAIDEWMKELGPDKRKQAKAMFGKIGELTLDGHEKKELYKNSVLAFASLRYKDALSALDNISPENLQEFTEVFAGLDDIEASLYYQIVQERLKIIDALREKVESNDLEKVIQKHLYEHLWLLDPSWDRATETPLMEQNVKTAFDEIDAGLTPEQKSGRFDIKYKMTSGKHVIIELKRASRKLRGTQLQDQVDIYRNALRKLVQATGKNEPIEVVCLVGQRLEDWETSEQEDESRRAMAAKNTRVVLYQELIEDAYRSYQAFLAQNQEAGRVYKLIREIEMGSE